MDVPKAMSWRRLTVAFRVGAWGCVVLLAFLSLVPAGEMARTGISGRIEHVVAYAGTALLAGLGYRTCGSGRITAALVAYAAALEMLQELSPGRYSVVGDWLASSGGVLLGTGLLYLAPGFALGKRAAIWRTDGK
jgi:hypothetical protein